jgi:Uma2 family endonuclease
VADSFPQRGFSRRQLGRIASLPTAQFGWLIDPDRRTVYVCRPRQLPEELAGLETIGGEGPVEGFRLDLQDIWQGL